MGSILPPNRGRSPDKWKPAAEKHSGFPEAHVYQGTSGQLLSTFISCTKERTHPAGRPWALARALVQSSPAVVDRIPDCPRIRHVCRVNVCVALLPEYGSD